MNSWSLIVFGFSAAVYGHRVTMTLHDLTSESSPTTASSGRKVFDSHDFEVEDRPLGLLELYGADPEDNDDTSLDLEVQESFATTAQPREFFEKLGNASLKSAVQAILDAAGPVQRELADVVSMIGNSLCNGNYIKYDPGTKSVASAVRKARRNNRIREVTDVYRASLVVESLQEIEGMVYKQDKTQPAVALVKLLEPHNFKVVRFRNSFEAPWPDGYRDLQIHLRHKSGLVGELQVHLCSVKKFTEMVGHKFYENLRVIKDPQERESQEKFLNAISREGYNNALSWPDNCCLSGMRAELQKEGMQ